MLLSAIRGGLISSFSSVRTSSSTHIQKMKVFQVVQRCASHELYRFNSPAVAKTLFTHSKFGGSNNDNQNTKSSESTDDFESSIFRGSHDDASSPFFRKLGRIENAHAESGRGSYISGLLPDEDDESFSTLSDGLDGKLKKAAKYFEYNEEEVEAENYSFRPDSNLNRGMTYTPEDLNLRKPGVWKATKQYEFEVTTEEVLKKADFRNVRFLANFLTEAGIIIKRSKTGISAKAQRKIAREIKTARAFGLMPFTTMGTKSFTFGRTMEDLDEDFMVQIYDDPIETDAQDSV